jgi:hypothetical protein
MCFRAAGTLYCIAILVADPNIWSAKLYLSGTEQIFIGPHKVGTKYKVRAIFDLEARRASIVNRTVVF